MNTLLLDLENRLNDVTLKIDIENEKLLDKYLNNKSIKKVIFVNNRLINILVNE